MVGTIISALSVRTSPERHLAEMDRMGLGRANGLQAKLYRHLLVWALERSDEARSAANQLD
jgi:hypothetical protein